MEHTGLMDTGNYLQDTALIDVLMLANEATAIYTNEELQIGFANDAMIAIWGKDRSVVGKTFEEAIPEIKGQPFTDLLKGVWQTGETYTAKDTPANLVVNGVLQTFYFNFEYRAIRNAAGQTYSLLHTAHDVTQNVLDRNAIADQGIKEQELIKELATSNDELAAVVEEYQASNEELSSLNEEYTALNEELNATNEELTAINEQLTAAHHDLSYSKSKLDQILNTLAAPVVVLLGPDHIISTTNKAILSFWNKKADEVLGRPMLEVFPELKTQPFPSLWKQVLETGETIVHHERPVYFNHVEGRRLFYVDYHYQPLKDLDGKVNRVLATVIDNTNSVVARKAVEQAETQLRLAIESSKLGTWHFNFNTKTFTASERFKELFGFHADEAITYENALACISDEHKDVFVGAMRGAIQNKVSFEQEFNVTGLHDHQLRWVRVTGQLYEGDDLHGAFVAGTLLDITESKQDDLRKNDFIGMVSHELKTPLTSLSAYIQMLASKAQKAEDTFTGGALEKANNQVKKMTAMINGFLNVSRLESGKIHLSTQHFNLEELIEEVQGDVQLTNPSHQLEFTKCEAIFVEADRDKIGQVINNFLSNAIKYSPKGKSIQLVCTHLDGTVQVSVKDEGIGIAEHDLERLFERYYRVENNQTKTISGFGIGLYLCAEIIYRHGGEIWAESVLGEGSTFYFSLPLA
ncbi:hypothetical protein GCM10023149_09110 [Mucilaginibacter gynuensis]|uniref:histidine kinase n=1 Tax=Mucilaginibacter gynuensis TaxID=1302236 RepID=A0ABP8FYC6_9SPHI